MLRVDESEQAARVPASAKRAHTDGDVVRIIFSLYVRTHTLASKLTDIITMEVRAHLHTHTHARTLSSTNASNIQVAVGAFGSFTIIIFSFTDCWFSFLR